MNETLERRALYRKGASSKAKLLGIMGDELDATIDAARANSSG